MIEQLINELWVAKYGYYDGVKFVVSFLQEVDGKVEGHVTINVLHWGVERQVSVFFNKVTEQSEVTKVLFDTAKRAIQSIEVGEEVYNRVYS